MRITKLLPLPIIFAVSVICCFGQSNTTIKPDLSGTWELDVGRSGRPPEQIKITHQDPELTIQRMVTIDGIREEKELTYFTDGRGERNPDAVEGEDAWYPSKTTSKTTWSKDRVMTRSVDLFILSIVPFEYEITDGWRLSSDGKTLTNIPRRVAKKDVIGNAAIGTDLKKVYKLISK